MFLRRPTIGENLEKNVRMTTSTHNLTTARPKNFCISTPENRNPKLTYDSDKELGALPGVCHEIVGLEILN